MNLNSAAELMAKMTAHGVQIDKVITSGSRTTVKLDAMHMAAACTGLPRWTYALLMSKYCGDVDLTKEAMLSGAFYLIRKHPHCSDPALARMVALVAYGEWLHESRCDACKGRGAIIKRTGLISACGRCDGGGAFERSDKQRAAFLEMPVKAYRELDLDAAITRLLNHMYDRQQQGLSRVFYKAVGA